MDKTKVELMLRKGLPISRSLVLVLLLLSLLLLLLYSSESRLSYVSPYPPGPSSLLFSCPMISFINKTGAELPPGQVARVFLQVALLDSSPYIKHDYMGLRCEIHTAVYCRSWLGDWD